jgi:predicted ATP-dependent endonuclease of OLD family
MKITKVIIDNYRLLKHVELRVDDTTVIVGKNNTGKTSLMNFIQLILSDRNKQFTFDDYPVSLRNDMYQFIIDVNLETFNIEEVTNFFKEPSIRIEIDYSSLKEDSPIGMLRPFVIDLDSKVTQAVLLAKFGLTLSKELFSTFIYEIRSNKEYIEGDDTVRKSIIRDNLAITFSSFYKLSVYAVNPINEEDKQLKTQEDLKNLLSIHFVRAERAMDESDEGNNRPLEKLLDRIFSPITDLENEDESKEGKKKSEIAKLRGGLQDVVLEFNATVNKTIDEKMAELIRKSIGFGYPDTEEVSLSARTNIKLDDQIKKNTDLWYVESSTNEFLPSTLNGLGYKNLLKIEFELVNYFQSLDNDSVGRIYLLFIEEPESHMHPQLQQKFIEFLSDYLKELSKKDVQVLITTHSSHIVNQVDFKKIRYVRRKSQEIDYKDLDKFSKEKPTNTAFIKKYLTLYKCDLFFADKAILFEGSSERLLLPEMIRKMGIEKKFDDVNIGLDRQYVTLIEVGGAYAHLFFDFLAFLEIPTLIITDIDSVGEDRKKCVVSKGISTSNQTIKEWLKQYTGYKEDKINTDQTLLELIQKLTDDNKTHDKIHLAFQKEENSICPRSLEEALINVNREIYELDESTKEEDIIFADKSKIDFALRLIIDHPNFIIPKYIQDGLMWLNKCSIYEEVKHE